MPCSFGVAAKVIIRKDAATGLRYVNTHFAMLSDTVMAQGWTATFSDSYTNLCIGKYLVVLDYSFAFQCYNNTNPISIMNAITA